MNLFENCKNTVPVKFTGWIGKSKPALSKLDSSCDTFCCVRLVMVALTVDVGWLQFLVCEDSLVCCVFKDF